MRTNEAHRWRKPIVSQKKRHLMSQVSLTVLQLRQYSANTSTGPGASHSVPKAGQKPFAAKHPSDDRYAILLKKLEDLEKVHADGKKAVR
jgi:hypothetical protein